MGNPSAKNLRWMLLRLGGLAALQGMVGYAVAANQSESFAFEKYKDQDNDTAKKLAGSELNGRFPIGTKLDNAITTLKEAGANCRILEKYPEFMYCTYEHADAGLRGMFVTVEWKVLVYFDKATNTTTRIEVNRGLTGL